MFSPFSLELNSIHPWLRLIALWSCRSQKEREHARVFQMLSSLLMQLAPRSRICFKHKRTWLQDWHRWVPRNPFPIIYFCYQLRAYSYQFKSQFEICPKNWSPITPLDIFFLIQPYMTIWKGTDEQPRIKFGKKVTADLSRHTILMNERTEGKWFSVYLSSVIRGTINYPSCQSAASLSSQTVFPILGDFLINYLHCTFLFFWQPVCVVGER